MGDQLYLERFVWFDHEARKERFPNANTLGAYFEIASKTAQRSIDHFRDRLQAPLEYDKSHIAGEWGHLSVAPDGAECYCSNRGCVETLISGSGVEAAFFREYGQRLTMDEIVAQARAGESRCKNTFDRFLDDFGRCLGGLISILDPDAAVVLGGGLSNSGQQRPDP
jgi:hypothetical protein